MIQAELISLKEPECCSGCGEGWDDLLTRLHNDLTEIDPDYDLGQFKQKFGELRFYASCNNEHGESFFARISEAEAESRKTCENCGKPGTMGGKYWIRVLCEECRKDVDSRKAT